MGDSDGPNDFFVTVSSNGSSHYFPKNTVREFSNRLAAPIRFSNLGDWEVGLTEISFPPMVDHVKFTPEDLDCMVLMEKVSPTGEITKRSTGKVQLRAFHDACSFLEMFRWALKESSELPSVFQESAPPVRLLMPVGKNIILFKLQPGFFITFSHKVWRMLGIDSAFRLRHNTIGSRSKLTKAYGYVDVRAGYRSAWVYSNCCDHRYVGDARVPLLRTVAIQSGEEDIIHRTYTHPYYLPVSQSFLPSLDVTLTDNTGRPMEHFPGETLVTLHFRRKRRGRSVTSAVSG